MCLPIELRNNSKPGKCGISFVNKAGLEEKLSYRELYANALNVLGSLQKRGVKTGDEVIIQLEDNKKFLIIFWGCLLGKIIPVPLSPGFRQELFLKLSKIWNVLKNPYLCVDEDNARWIGSLVEVPGGYQNLIVRRTLLVDELFSFGNAGATADISGEDIAYLQFSSGSTGEPKGVCLTHNNIISNVSDIISSLKITGSDLLLNWMPLTHDMGMVGFHLTGLMRGIDQVCISTAAFIRRPLYWMEKAAATKASVLYSPNFGLHYFLSAFRNIKEPSLDLSGIRIIVNGAEPISTALTAEFIATLAPHGLKKNVIVAAYGLAEATVEVACTSPGAGLKAHYLNRRMLKIGDRIDILDEDTPDGLFFAEVGLPVSNCELRICDEEGFILPENTVGHIQIRGKNIAAGYYNDPVATAAVFAKDNWLKTGDIGFLRSGNLTVTGRAKNIIVVNGQNYYPHDIERVIQHAGISELGKVAACGTSDRERGQEELLVFVLHKESPEEFVPVHRSIRETILKEFGIGVNKVIPVRRMPKTTSGKIQHYLLVEQYLKGDYDMVLSVIEQYDLHDGPLMKNDTDDLEKYLIEISKDQLGIKDVSPDGNLFDAGINSMLAIQLAERIKVITGIPFSVDTIFENQSISKIAAYLHQQSPRFPRLRLDKADVDKILPVKPALYYPLSPAQRRLWFLYVLEPDSVNYNESMVFELKGYLDLGILRATFSEIIKRHQILRTNIVEIDAVPCQVVQEGLKDPVCITYADISGIETPFVEVKDLIRSIVLMPFKLDAGPLYRICVFKTDLNRHLLCIVMHHIITDEWSGNILLNELKSIYPFLSKGLHSPLPALETQYVDYANWINGKIRDHDREKDRDFWRKEFKDIPPALKLPSHSNLPGSRQDDGCELCFKIEKQQLKDLQSLGQQENMSVFMLFISAIYVLLSKYTGQNDITIGISVAGRDHPQTNNMLGFFVNILPLRIEVVHEDAITELLQKVKRKCLTGFDHRLYFFDEMISDLEFDRIPGQMPLFNVLVSYSDNRMAGYYDDDPDSNLKIQQADTRIISGKYDMEFYFDERRDITLGRIIYRLTHFSETRMERMAAHFGNILNAICRDPAMPVSALDYLTEEEKGLLNGFNNTATTERKDTILDLFLRNVVQKPSATAVVYRERSFSYGEINEKADLVAGYLLQKYLAKRNDLVALLLSRSEYIVIGILGIWKAGATYVPLDAAMPPERLSMMLKQINARVILTSGDCEATCRSVIKDLSPHDNYVTIEQILMDSMGAPPSPAGIADLAYIMFTSGTSGIPKAVRVYHHSVVNILLHLHAVLKTGHSDKLLSVSNYIFDISVAELFLPLISGGELIIAPGTGITDAKQLKKIFELHNPSLMQATPGLWNMLIGAQWNGSAILKVITCGEPLTDNLKQKLMERAGEVWNMYGPTETTIFSTGLLIRDAEEQVSIGRPVRNTRIHILDEYKRPVPIGVFGELYIAGKGLSGGYLDGETLNGEKFLDNICREPRLAYRTGDIGRWLDNGCIELQGRSDDQIKLRGIRTEPAEIENSILSLENIQSCVVLARNDGKGELMLVGYIVLSSQDPDWEEKLRSGLSKRLPEYMIPGYFVLLKSLPLTYNGKTDRRSLAERSLENAISKSKNYVAPRTERERKML